MDKVEELRHRAAECRRMAAATANLELKAHYERLAVIWDKLARERQTYFVKNESGAPEPS